MIAWLCPGQGMERPGMGLDVAGSSPEAAALLDVASAATGVDLPRWLRDPGRAGGRTDLAQPAMVAVTLGAGAALLARGRRPDRLAGHSLGELSAWALAGGVGLSEAVVLAARRGRIFADIAAHVDGGMRSIPWEDVPTPLPDGLTRAVENPDGLVVSGPRAALDRLRIGASVATAGPWHSPSMAAAAAPWAACLDALPTRRLATPVVSNHDGQAHGGDLRPLLVAQLTHHARWRHVLATLVADGVTDVVILGPSKVLRHHVRLAAPDTRVWTTERAADLDGIPA